MRKRTLVIAFTAVASFLMLSCANQSPQDSTLTERDYRQDMREFVQAISTYAKETRPDFIIIPQNGQELLVTDDEDSAAPAEAYIEAIDGIGREDLFYGYSEDNVATRESDRDYMLPFTDIARDNGLAVLITDYCSTIAFMDDSYSRNQARGYLSFAADHRELDDIPTYPARPHNVNSDGIRSLGEAKNFLYLINPDSYSGKAEFLKAVAETDYDVLIIDAFFGDRILTPDDVSALKRKSSGGSRLVIAYMSIGESESYRYYWQDEWENEPPAWMADENPDWPGNYKVRYWDPEWQSIIFGNSGSYLDRIADAGFDGVYLDIIDAFEYFENQ